MDKTVKNSQLRIIGGQYRSRIISFPNTHQIRPTPNRVRETLFNWLQTRIGNARCLDAFAGSGALSFEAVSRGAASSVAFEKNTEFANSIQHNCSILKTNLITVYNVDFFDGLSKLKAHVFDVVFLDPPFGQGLLIRALEALQQYQLLTPQSVIYFEVEKEFDLAMLPKNMVVKKSQIAGQVCYGILESFSA